MAVGWLTVAKQGVIFPAISFLGQRGEAKFFYQIGFAGTGEMLLCLSLPLFTPRLLSFSLT